MQTKFSHRIDFGFGVELDRDFKPIPPETLANCLKFLIASANGCFGGCTITETHGSWVNDKGQVFTERGRTLTVYCHEAANYRARGFAKTIKHTLNQEAVFVSISRVHAALI